MPGIALAATLGVPRGLLVAFSRSCRSHGARVTLRKEFWVLDLGFLPSENHTYLTQKKSDLIVFARLAFLSPLAHHMKKNDGGTKLRSNQSVLLPWLAGNPSVTSGRLHEVSYGCR